MKSRPIFILLASVFCLASSASFAEESPYGIVNFTKCVTESKYGKQEQESFEDLRKQVTNSLTEIEKQCADTGEKLKDSEFVDSLSPEAHEEMKARFQTLSEQLYQGQNQYMQIMQQANMQLMQSLNERVERATQSVAAKRKLPLVVRQEACFYYTPSLDITEFVITEMNKTFDQENVTQTDDSQEKN